MSPGSIVGGLASLPYLRTCKTLRESSWDRTGGNKDAIEIGPGDSATLAEIKGPGIIRHIWFTIGSADPQHLRKILLRMYWDGEEKPSVESPVGDFFGVGHGMAKHFISLPLTMTTGRGYNCYFPMPFQERAEIAVLNECEGDVKAFYYHIDYELHDQLDDDLGYFHAKWRRELTKASKSTFNTDGKSNYLILKARGRGQYVGCTISVNGLRPGWWGEGDDMIFIDGEKWPPSIHGTGTEDYFNAAWGFNREFYGPYHGFPLKGPDDWTGSHSMYRFHIEDPVVFKKSILVSIEHGHANNRGDDWSSVAYWYQTEPHIEFYEMPSADERASIPICKKPGDLLRETLDDIRTSKLDTGDVTRYFESLHNTVAAIPDIPAGVKPVLSKTMYMLWASTCKDKVEAGKVDEARKLLEDLYETAIGALKNG